MTDKATGAGGWPLVPSPYYAGEQTLACPKCGATNVTMTTVYPFRGTGSRGQGRLGDPGSKPRLICEGCGHKKDYE